MGPPQPAKATIHLPKVDPAIIAACKAVNPNYGHFELKQRGEGASSDPSPDPNPK